MKLGEAKNRLEQIKVLLGGWEVALERGPTGCITEMLDDCINLLTERHSLEKRISETELTTTLEGSILAEVQAALVIVNQKLHYLNLLAGRGDLPETELNKIFGQLASLRSAQDNIENNVNRCLWETDLLDE